MIAATVPGGSASYLYDHDNRRVKQIAGGNTTYYLWDELSAYGDVALETDGSNNVTASYALGIRGIPLIYSSKYFRFSHSPCFEAILVNEASGLLGKDSRELKAKTL